MNQNDSCADLTEANSRYHGSGIPVRSSVARGNLPESDLRANSARTRSLWSRSVCRSVGVKSIGRFETVLSSLSSLYCHFLFGHPIPWDDYVAQGLPSSTSNLPCVPATERLFVHSVKRSEPMVILVEELGLV